MRNKIKNSVFILIGLLVVWAGLYGIGFADGNVTALSVTPDPVKIGSTATIQYTLNAPGLVYLNVYKDTGELVRTLLDGANKAASTWSQVWDTRDNAGNLVANGSYRFTIAQKNASGDVIGSTEITKLAAVVPIISAVTDSSDPFNPTVGEKVYINYTLSHDALVTVTILNGYTPVKTLCSNTLVTAGVNTIPWDGKDSTGKIVGDANYTYQIDAVSPQVATFKSTQKSTVAVEKEAPQITSFSANPNPMKLGINNLTMSYTLSESSKVTLAIKNSNGIVKRTLLNAVSKNAGTNTVSWDGRDDAGTLVAEGSYTVVLNAVDNFNKSSGDKTLTINAGYLPAINNAAVSPTAFNPNAQENNKATISYSLSNDAVVTVQILNGYTPVKTLVNKVTQPAGTTQSVLWDGTDSSNPAKIVGDGNYTFQITATSPAVSTFSSTFKGTVAVEKGGPSITGLSVNPNPMKLGVNNLAISFTVSEAATVTARVYNGTTPVRTLIPGDAKNAGFVSTSWDGKNDAGNLVEEANYTLKISARDAAGKFTDVTAGVTAGFVPSVTGLTVTPQPYTSTSGPANINFTLSNQAKVKVTISQGYTVIRTLDLSTLQAGVNTTTWDGKDSSGKVAADGSYTCKVEATSPLVSTFIGNATGTITVTGADPTVSGLSVSPAVVKIPNTATFRYTLSEPGTITAQITDTQGAELRSFAAETKASAGSYSFTWDGKNTAGSSVTPGTYILKLTAVDQDNISTTAQMSFQAGVVPIITDVTANPPNIDLSKGEKSTTISYTVDVESYVTVKAQDASSKFLKNLIINKRVNGTDSVVFDVYQNGQPLSGTLGFSIDASSVIGYFKSQTATGSVSVGGASSGTTKCTDCHQGYPTIHPMQTCSGCHTANQGPIDACAACHVGFTHDNGTVLGKFQCTFCHNATYPTIPGHGDITTLHDTNLGADCEQCHNQNLSVEHPLHFVDPDNTVPFDCSVCHGSSATQTVKDAVYNGNKTCTACHGTSTGGHEEMHTPTGINTSCTECHKDSLTQEHLSNPTTQTGNTWTCDTCHSASASQSVKDAVYNNDRTCTACHGPGGDHKTVHQTNVLDSNCTTCHINNLVEEHLTNAETQTDPNDPTKLKGWTCDTCHKSTDPLVVGALATENMQCAACHREGHGLNFAENVLADIELYQNASNPLYPNGYIWTTPQDASLWAGESWMPTEFIVGGKLLISSRRNDVVAQTVYDFYYNGLTAKGWTGISSVPDLSTKYFDVTFTKGIHKAKIMFYGGQYHDAAPVVPGGYRIEILYK